MTNKASFVTEDHFHLYSLSTVHTFLSYTVHIMSFSSYNGYELSLHLTCLQRGFIAQLLEHCAGVTEVMGLNFVGASEFFLSFICNCFSYFITVRISCVLYPECTHNYDLYHILYIITLSCVVVTIIHAKKGLVQLTSVIITVPDCVFTSQ